MCNRYTPARSDDPLYALLGREVVNYPPPRRIGPFALAPFLRPGADGVELVVGQWGMVRPGARARREMVGGRPRLTNNARSETLAEKPTFRAAWARGQRCLIPAASFDEPNWESGKAQWWEFRRADGRAWAIAGLWSEWVDPETGEVLPNFTMPTINADHHPLMSRMHRPDPDLAPDAQDKRSIVPLDPADWATWLGGSADAARALLKLPPAADYDAGPAS